MPKAKWTRQEETLVTSAVRTANGQGSALAPKGEKVRLFLDVSAAGGTSPTLDVKVDVRDPLSGNWVQNAEAFAQVTGTGTTSLVITNPLGTEFRIRWVIGGTSPSFTFSVGAVWEGHI